MGGNYPLKAATLWRDALRPRDIASRYAKLAKSLCPSLKHIKIGQYAWEIEAPEVFETEEDIYTQIKLRRLDNYEANSIEIFAIRTFMSQAALPGFEPPDKPETETEV